MSDTDSDLPPVEPPPVEPEPIEPQSEAGRAWRRPVALIVAMLLVVAGMVVIVVVDDNTDDDGEDFCEQARVLEEMGDDLSEQESLEALRDLSDDAPAEIEAELAVLIEFLELAVEAGDDEDAQREAAEDIDEDELTEASEALTAYLEEECGLTDVSQ